MQLDDQLKLKRFIIKCRKDPVFFVRKVFNCEPDKWQIEALEAYRDNQRVCAIASKGVGKTTFLSWCIWHFIFCYPNSKIASTSISFQNLSDGLRAELALWLSKSKLLQRYFTLTKTRIFSNEYTESWFCSFRAWSKSADATTQADTLAGLHADYILFVMDEVGSYPESIIATAEASLSSGKICKMLAMGNPTNVNGPLYKMSISKDWKAIHINGDPDNPNRSPRVSIEWAQKQIDTYGRNSAWVKVNVFGEFPEQGLNNLFSREMIERAKSRLPDKDVFQSYDKRLGVDVARFGEDTTVIFPRQGHLVMNPIILPQARTYDITNRIALINSRWEVSNIFVDGTGGFGSGVVDHLLTLGLSPIEVHFASKASDDRFANARAEMYFRLSEYIEKFACLPNIKELEEELLAITYDFNSKGQLIIDSKDQIKELLGRSPDCFIGATKIKTPTGYQCINSLTEGDMVCTPYGITKIIKVWRSQAQVIEFKYKTYKLIGKASHTVFTYNRGWVRLDQLNTEDVLEIDNFISRLKWKILNMCFTKVKNIEFKHQVDIIQATGKIRGIDFYIGLSGFSTLERFLKGIIFTIKTEIGEIINWPILNVLKEVSIKASILKKDGPLTMSNVNYNLKRPLSNQRNGTQATRVENGTQSMEKAHGKIGKLKLKNAMPVNQTWRLSSIGKCFALLNVSKKNMLKKLEFLTNVSSVQQSLVSTNIASKPTAPENVERLQDVYNLTLENHNVYYANNILVSNCSDALALTFYNPDMIKINKYINQSDKALSDFDPFR